MGNYDLRCQRFVLIHNAGVKILPEDVIDIESFSDYLILEDEPEGFDEATLVLERDERYHGFNYEYSVDMLRYACDFGKRYLVDIFETDGTDADVKFVYGYGTINQFEVLYVGGLDFNQYTIENNEYVAINLRKDDFGNILQTAFDIPQSVEPTEDVLLYSKAIPRRLEYGFERINTDLTPFPTTNPAIWSSEFLKSTSPDVYRIIKTDPSGYLFFNENKEGDDEQVFPSYPFQIDGVEPIDPSKLKFFVRAKSGGVYNIDVTFWLGMYISNESTDYGFVKLKTIKTEADGETVIETKSYDFVDSFVPDFLTAPNAVLQFEESLSEVLNIDECLYLFIEFDTDSSSFGTNLFVNSVIYVPYQFNLDAPVITVNFNSFAEDSVSKFEPAFNVLDGILTQAAEVNYSLFKSDFFESGCGSKLYLSNGANIRNLVGDDEKLLIKDSPKGIVDKFVDLFNMGWGIEYGGYEGNEVVRMEPCEYFYQDNLLMEFEGDLIVDYEKAVDPSKYYNEIEIGFSKYSKERETEKGGTLDDVHTKHVYQTPIKTNKNKLSVMTDLILSGYEIEFARRKQFDKTGGSSNSNFSDDDSIFGVQLVESVMGSTVVFSSEETITEEDFYTIISIYLDTYILKAGDIVTYTSRDGVVQTRTVVSYSSTRTPVLIGDETIFVDFTIIQFEEELVGSKVGTGELTIENLSFEPILIPESTQPFDSIENLVSPTTAYNIRHTPKRMLLSWAKMFNGGFRTKGDDELIEFRQGDGNTSLSTQFGEGETCLLGDIDRAVINEGSNLRLDQTYGRDYLFLPYKVSFSYPLTFDDLNYIRRSMRGMNEYDNYGYIQYVNPAGEVEQVYLTSIKFMPSKEEATIEGYVKATFPVQFTGNYIIDENDQFVYDEVSLPIPYDINEEDDVDLSLDHTLDVEI
jgi:hypothetical protein